MTLIELPEWPGSACINVRCSGSTKHRVLSIVEAKRVYPVKDKLSWWPVPDQATHVCTVCGFVYDGVADDYRDRQTPTPPSSIEVDIGAWEWSHEQQFDGTVREAVEAFVLAAPDAAGTDEIAAGVDRFVAGADGEFAREVMLSLDEYEETVITADEFM